MPKMIFPPFATNPQRQSPHKKPKRTGLERKAGQAAKAQMAAEAVEPARVPAPAQAGRDVTAGCRKSISMPSVTHGQPTRKRTPERFISHRRPAGLLR